MKNDGGNSEAQSKIRYIKNQESVYKANPTQVSDQEAREMFAEFLSKQCSPAPIKPEYEQTLPTVGVNTGVFLGCVGPDLQPKYRDPVVAKLLARKGINGEQALGDQIRFSEKDKAKMYDQVLKLAAATDDTASIVIASENNGGWGRHAGVLTATKGTGEDINWAYVDIYQLMDYLTTYHSAVAFKYLRDVEHSK